MKTTRLILLSAGIVLAAAIIIGRRRVSSTVEIPRVTLPAPFVPRKVTIAAAAVASPFTYNFGGTETIEETDSMRKSADPYWWVNSGAYLRVASGTGETVQGELPARSLWRIIYAHENPADTDGGYHPQNIFRLVSRSTWQNFHQSAYFWIVRDQLSVSKNRNESNGILLFNRYQNGDNLYYTGLRVDGTAIIKKKIAGEYYTMAQTQMFPGIYDKASSPDLLPHQAWLGLRSEIITNSDGTVGIKLYTDINRTGTWTLAAQATDDGKSFGGAPIFNRGYAGIRTDFMDVKFSEWTVTTIGE